MGIGRVVIIGGVAGGASVAARLRRQDEHASIVMLERGPHVSFANCGLPYFVGGVIGEAKDLLVSDARRFREWFRVDVRTGHEVLAIDRARQEVEVLARETGVTYREPYDHLVLATGAAPLRPPIPGIDLPGIFSLRDVPDAERITSWIAERAPRRAVVVGGGFIGLEVTENLVRRGLEVSVLEAAPQLLPPLDPEMTLPVQAELAARGVSTRLADGVARFEPADAIDVVSTSGHRERAGLVILAMGVRPETRLAVAAGLALGPRGGIQVDAAMRTSDPRIQAVGDTVEVVDAVTAQPALIPLAGPANRQGRLAADALTGREVAFRGVQGTAVVQVFGVTVASTGASEKALVRTGVAHEKIYLHANSHATYYPGAEGFLLKVLFAPDGRLLGAQAAGGASVARRIDVLAAFLQMRATVFDLEQAELAYSPQHGSAKDPVNIAGFIAANHLRGDAPLVHWDRWRPDGEPLVVDVRANREREAGPPVPGSVHIPLPDLRERLAELPRDRALWVHCAGGQRSHVAVRLLRQHGLDARNLSGGYRLHAMLAGPAT